MWGVLVAVVIGWAVCVALVVDGDPPEPCEPCLCLEVQDTVGFFPRTIYKVDTARGVGYIVFKLDRD